MQAPFVSLLFYVATDGQGTLQPLVEEKSRRLLSLTGTTEELGHFTITFQHPTTEAGTAPLYARYSALWLAGRAGAEVPGSRRGSGCFPLPP